MANTKTALKRSRQTVRKTTRNQTVKARTSTALKNAKRAIQKQDLELTKTVYRNAVSALAKAASKKAIPARRAARKISRLTKMAKKLVPAALSLGNQNGKTS